MISLRIVFHEIIRLYKDKEEQYNFEESIWKAYCTSKKMLQVYTINKLNIFIIETYSFRKKEKWLKLDFYFQLKCHGQYSW